MESKKMKIIQSFWGGKNKSIENKYGWADYKLHWLAWMLSCHQLRKYYDRVELYTDEFGYDILINKLQLPYTKVHVVLDDLNDLPNDLWAMAKLKAYSMQDEPFLHVDGDVFIFEPFPTELLNSKLVAQNPENTTKYYRDMWNKIQPNLVYLPTIMYDYNLGKSNKAYNMGIIGGIDVDFFKRYTQLSYDFVYKNSENWNSFNLLNFNVFFEQVLFYECVRSENKEVNILIHEDIGDNEYLGFGDFDSVPDKRTYLHLLGVFKQDIFTCSKMLQYCWYHHPEWLKILFDITIPDYKKQLEFTFTKEENEKLVKWYTKHITDQEINPQRLLARDLFTYEQISVIDKYEKMGMDYQIILLPEIVIKSNDDDNANELFIKEISQDFFIRTLDQMDEVIIYELNTPKRKSELLQAIMGRFEEEPTTEEKESFKTILYELIRHYIGLKIMAVKNID